MLVKEKYSEQFEMFVGMFMLSYLSIVLFHYTEKSNIENVVILMAAFINVIIYGGILTLALSFFVIIHKWPFKTTMFYSTYGAIVAGLLVYCIIKQEMFHLTALCMGIIYLSKDMMYLLKEYEETVPRHYGYYDQGENS